MSRLDEFRPSTFDPDTMGAAVGEAIATTDALLFGRRTWQTMAARLARPCW